MLVYILDMILSVIIPQGLHAHTQTQCQYVLCTMSWSRQALVVNLPHLHNEKYMHDVTHNE